MPTEAEESCYRPRPPRLRLWHLLQPRLFAMIPMVVCRLHPVSVQVWRDLDTTRDLDLDLPARVLLAFALPFGPHGYEIRVPTSSSIVNGELLLPSRLHLFLCLCRFLVKTILPLRFCNYDATNKTRRVVCGVCFSSSPPKNMDRDVKKKKRKRGTIFAQTTIFERR